MSVSDLRLTISELVADLRNNIFTEAQEQGDLLLVEFWFKKLSDETLLAHVIEHVLPYKPRINRSDATFFVQKRNEIFAGLPQERIDYFGKMFELRVSSEDVDTICSYFKIIVAIAERAKKNK